ncbi:MAG: hypothetical protein K8H88_21325 [Sandaracinaceae bacterium]|nr:hypothetical protein [Sandaracinaceae bacterium]
MSIDGYIDGLAEEANDTVRQLLRQAYEHGFRQALATSGLGVAAEAVPGPLTRDTEPPAAELAPNGRAIAWIDDALPDLDPERSESPSSVGLDWGEEDDDEEPQAAAVPVIRPILPHATVGTLRKRIVRMFDLERFDIDVVICRRGDAARRQLKSTARLRLYLRDER